MTPDIVAKPDRATSIYLAHLDIVHGCQLRCVGCPNSILLPKISLVDETDFAAMLANIDVERIHLLRLYNFGEPLLHRHLSRLLQHIPRQVWKAEQVELSTNAQKVYWEDFEAAIRTGVLTRIVVSCDGDGTPADYERLRPPSQWSKFLEFLQRTRELRDRWAPDLELTTMTICEVPAQRERWSALLEPLGWAPRFRRWMWLPESSENRTGRTPRVGKGACFFMAPASDFNEHSWDGQINLLYADADGTVVPCCVHPQAGVLGNLRRQTYSEILGGSARVEFIAQLRTARADMAVCGRCEIGPVGDEGPAFDAAMDS